MSTALKCLKCLTYSCVEFFWNIGSAEVSERAEWKWVKCSISQIPSFDMWNVLNIQNPQVQRCKYFQDFKRNQHFMILHFLNSSWFQTCGFKMCEMVRILKPGFWNVEHFKHVKSTWKHVNMIKMFHNLSPLFWHVEHVKHV